MKFEVDHIGIAVQSIAEGRGFYEALGLGPMHEEEVASENVKVGMFKTDNGAKLELLEATSESSAIHKFIEKRGPGIHHICLKVEDIDLALKQLKEKSIRLIHEEAKVGAGGCRIAFVHPSATGGVLLELSEPPQGGQ